MKTTYLDSMEAALSAYSPARIRAYIDEVARDGLTEHGFPRLGANIGILMFYGRRLDLKDRFIEIMDLCCDEMPRKKAANDFSIREVCCCLMLLEQSDLIPPAMLLKWKRKLSEFDPWSYYNEVDDRSGKFVANWAMFAAVSEYVRGVYCGIDTSAFVDWQLPCQLANFDCNGMYMDDPPYNNHAMYDLVPRFLLSFLLCAGYRGKYAERIAQVLDSAATLTLQMQSVTGELPYGGRSNQFLHNEAMLCSYCEMEASRFAEKGDCATAEKFRGAARLAANSSRAYLALTPKSHIKNRYDVASKIGCEEYGYFNKYMITVASNLYPSILFANEEIAVGVAPTEAGGYFAQTSERFHRVFLNRAGYFLEWDTAADPHYDANGLGRVHKSGCPSPLCLSVPFAKHPNYATEGENPTAMSLCCFAEDGRRHIGAECYAAHKLVHGGEAEAVFEVTLAAGLTVTERYAVDEDGVKITLSGAENLGFFLPVFEFDGEAETAITVGETSVSVTYRGATCRYLFDGTLDPEYQRYYNRNGRYRVYAVHTEALHISME